MFSERGIDSCTWGPMQERIQKRIWNITVTVFLKFCWNTNTSQFFVRSRLLIKVCVRTIFEALRRRSPDNGLLVKKRLAQFVMWGEANLDSELTLPVYCNCKLIHEHLSCDGFEVNNSRWHIAVCSWNILLAATTGAADLMKASRNSGQQDCKTIITNMSQS